MFTVTPNGENRVDIEINGDVDADTMKLALDDLLTHSENVTNGRMLYTVTNFHWPTLGAIGVELTRFPSLFRLAFKFKRAALLTDESWVKNIGEFKGAVIPSIEIKAFKLDQKSEAEAWLEQQPDE